MQYQQHYKTYSIGQYRTSEIELQDIFRAWLAISVAFAIVLGRNEIFSINFLYNFLLSAFTVGIGFLLHELAHKLVAQHYGCFAEFRAFNSMLVLAIAMSFLFGVVFAAPGAVMIQGRVDRIRNGRISLAGPLTNLVIALVFLGLWIGINPAGSGYLESLFHYGFMINAFLALFNLIPIFNFDGSKIYAWNKLVYFLVIVVSFGMVYFSF